MKKRLALLLPLLAFAVPASAQSGLSIVGGVVSSSFTGEDDEGNEADDIASRLGFAVGVGLSGGMTQGLSFAPEVLYVQKGGNEDGGDAYLKMTFIEVPLLFRYYFGGGGSMMPFITGGPAVAYMLGCDLGDDDGSETCDEVYGEDDSYKKLDYGVMVGVGASFNRVTITARYDLGLANTDKADGFSHKNKALMLLGSVSF